MLPHATLTVDTIPILYCTSSLQYFILTVQYSNHRDLQYVLVLATTTTMSMNMSMSTYSRTQYTEFLLYAAAEPCFSEHPAQ